MQSFIPHHDDPNLHDCHTSVGHKYRQHTDLHSIWEKKYFFHNISGFTKSVEFCYIFWYLIVKKMSGDKRDTAQSVSERWSSVLLYWLVCTFLIHLLRETEWYKHWISTSGDTFFSRFRMDQKKGCHLCKAGLYNRLTWAIFIFF